MRKLTDHDIANIIGTIHQDYHIIDARIKRGSYCDSDHYGIILGYDYKNLYVTWQFHLDEDDKPSIYWGHYMEDKDVAVRDFNIRDIGTTLFEVTITETLKQTVEVEAKDQQEAEQIVSDSWHDGKYVLDSDNFVEVEFNAMPAEQGESR